MALVLSTVTVTADSYTLRVYPRGVATPYIATTIDASQLTCNQAPPTTMVTQNPTQWVWDDPAAPMRVCIYDDGMRLLSLPDGEYEGTAQTISSDGLMMSPETPRVAFFKGQIPMPAGCMDGLTEYAIGDALVEIVKSSSKTSTIMRYESQGWAYTSSSKVTGNWWLYFTCAGVP